LPGGPTRSDVASGSIARRPATSTTIPAAPSGSAPAVETSTTTTAPAPTTTTTTAAVTDLADGRHPAYIKTVSVKDMTLTFDVIQFFIGADAEKEAAKNGNPPPDNDYLIRNVNPKLRTLSVDPAVTVDITKDEGTVELMRVSFATLAARSYEDALDHQPFWLTLDGGLVTHIEQQFVP
jgi:hypothetical protein